MDKISIIIPVYNVEPYIEKCLDSILKQTYKNLEIICINDGSTDGSGRICDVYVQKDERIRVFHKENEGVGSARNIGLEHFTGKYIAFVDPDDWIEPQMYEVLYSLVKSQEVSIGVVNYYKDTIDSTQAMCNQWAISSGVIDSHDILLYAFNRDHYMGFGAYLWNKLFVADIITANGKKLAFNHELEVGEDIVFFANVVLRGATAKYVNTSLYHYLQRPTSLFHSKNIKKKSDSLKAYLMIIALLEKNNIAEDIAIWVKRFYCYHASLLAEIAIKNYDKKNLILMQIEMNRYLVEYIATNKHIPERIKRIEDLLTAEIS